MNMKKLEQYFTNLLKIIGGVLIIMLAALIFLVIVHFFQEALKQF